MIQKTVNVMFLNLMLYSSLFARHGSEERTRVELRSSALDYPAVLHKQLEASFLAAPNIAENDVIVKEFLSLKGVLFGECATSDPDKKPLFSRHHMAGFGRDQGLTWFFQDVDFKEPIQSSLYANQRRLAIRQARTQEKKGSAVSFFHNPRVISANGEELTYTDEGVIKLSKKVIENLPYDREKTTATDYRIKKAKDGEGKTIWLLKRDIISSFNFEKGWNNVSTYCSLQPVITPQSEH